MKYRHLICALLFSIFFGLGNAQTRSLPSSVHSWTRLEGLRHATVSLEVMRLPLSKKTAKTGPKVIYSLDPERMVTPASVMKLVTTATALRILGGDYIWPDSIAVIDTSAVVPLKGLEQYNPDWLIEDVGTSYMPPLTDLQPDSGRLLRDVVEQTLCESLNFEAETLLRMLTPSLRLDSGLLLVSSYWEGQGLDIDPLRMYDGCGLAPSDRVTAHFICSLLAQMQFDEDFRAALPVVAREGTVSNFLKGTRLAGKAALKTGTLKNVVAYAGYAKGSDGRTYAVSVFVNNPTCPIAEVRKDIAKVLLSLIP